MVTLLYGDEPQLIEEKKEELLQQYRDRTLFTFREDQGIASLMAHLQEDSLFAEKRVFLLVHIPIFKKANKSVAPPWEQLSQFLLSYEGEDPIIIVYPETIDGRMKVNKTFIDGVESYSFMQVKGEALLDWIREYCKTHKKGISPDGFAYLRDMIDLWQDVPLSFIKTELDRLFLQSTEKIMTQEFLQEHLSDFGEKNIFRFKDALIAKDGRILLELFPSLLQYKSVEGAMAYIHNQMHLQLMVSECAFYHMNLKEIQQLFKEKGYKVNDYPVKLAYEGRKKILIPSLVTFITALYEIMLHTREGKGDMQRFQDICLAYCAS